VIVGFTRHARNRLRFYRLSQDAAVEVLNAPGQVTPRYHGRMNAWKRMPGGWLRITYIDEGEVRVVVTVTLRPRGPGEVEDEDHV